MLAGAGQLTSDVKPYIIFIVLMFMMAYVIVIYIPPWGVVNLHIGVDQAIYAQHHAMCKTTPQGEIYNLLPR